MEENSGKTKSYIYQTVNKLVLRNIVIIVLLIVFAKLYDSSKVASMAKSLANMEKAVAQGSTSALLLTEDGIPIEADKRIISAYGRKETVAKPLLDYLFTDLFTITNNMTKTEFKNYNEIYNNVENFKIFKNEYIELKMPSYYVDENGEEQSVFKPEGRTYKTREGKSVVLLKNKYKTQDLVEYEKKGNSAFNSYLSTLLDLARLNSLPHSIKIREYKISDYQTDGAYFSIELKVLMMAHQYYEENKVVKTVMKQGWNTIKADGFFNIRTRTRDVKGKKYEIGINKLGLRFYNIETELLTFSKEKNN